ncbi:alpha/beta hydrolase family protein [Noviherbaspirillum sp. ST9]|uniref:alpha/beta hydrolase family protein n=1 Tax=Noviherbaspirillum sp. ST9 TaxID=3401606 RepID=UPI003B5894D9
MSFPVRIIAVLFLLLCQACSHIPLQAGRVGRHKFAFADGGTARYFVLDKPSDAVLPPSTYLFMIPGSDCGSMDGVLPGYFDGLDGRAGAIRIFILHKRFIGADAQGSCSAEFIRADHPERWLADQEEFIRAELSAARVNDQPPERIVIVGMSEGAEIAPLLAKRIPGVTHVALLANGGMDPFDTYRLQMQRHGFHQAVADIERACALPSDEMVVSERTCRYWQELRTLRHADNLLALDTPVFIAMGEEDTLVPIESAWFIREKFTTAGKKNLHLLTVPGTGHDFLREGKSALPYLWDALEQWLQK